MLALVGSIVQQQLEQVCSTFKNYLELSLERRNTVRFLSPYFITPFVRKDLGKKISIRLEYVKY